MSQIDELRRIIVGTNSEELAELKNRVESLDARTRDVAEVLAPAIHRGIKDSDDLIDALKHPVSEGLKQAIRKEPVAYADILYPAIAPSIRLAISQAISSLLATINQTIESATSISGLRTRYESLRTGVPYAELALRQSLIYRVEHIYLIDRDSGLLISECAASDDIALDSDAVSAMFSAIQSFVQDSFRGGQEDRLTDFTVGAHNVWIVHGPKAMLACVIFGDAPELLKAQLYDSLDIIRTQFAAQIEEFDGDNADFSGVEQLMQPLLQLRLKEGIELNEGSDKKISLASKLLLLALLVLAVYFSVQWFDRYTRLGTLQHYLARTPGMVVTASYWQGKKIVVEGLQDPDAQLPLGILQAHKITIQDLDLRTKPFRSLEPKLEVQRFADEFVPPIEVELIAGDETVKLAGMAPIRWLLQHDKRLRQLAMDKRLELGDLTASETSVRQFLQTELSHRTESENKQLADSLLNKGWIDVSLLGLSKALSDALSQKTPAVDDQPESVNPARDAESAN